MSSARNYSIEVLRGMHWANAIYHQKYQKRFREVEARLPQSPDQTRALTTEQQDLNNRVLAVSGVFEETAKQIQELYSLFVDYTKAKANDQPQLRNQIQAMIFNEIRPMFRNLVARLKELEGIKK